MSRNRTVLGNISTYERHIIVHRIDNQLLISAHSVYLHTHICKRSVLLYPHIRSLRWVWDSEQFPACKYLKGSQILSTIPRPNHFFLLSFPKRTNISRKYTATFSYRTARGRTYCVIFFPFSVDPSFLSYSSNTILSFSQSHMNELFFWSPTRRPAERPSPFSRRYIHFQ